MQVGSVTHGPIADSARQLVGALNAITSSVADTARLLDLPSGRKMETGFSGPKAVQIAPNYLSKAQRAAAIEAHLPESIAAARSITRALEALAAPFVGGAGDGFRDANRATQLLDVMTQQLSDGAISTTSGVQRHGLARSDQRALLKGPYIAALAEQASRHANRAADALDATDALSTISARLNEAPHPNIARRWQSEATSIAHLAHRTALLGSDTPAPALRRETDAVQALLVRDFRDATPGTVFRPHHLQQLVASLSPEERAAGLTHLDDAITTRAALLEQASLATASPLELQRTQASQTFASLVDAEVEALGRDLRRGLDEIDLRALAQSNKDRPEFEPAPLHSALDAAEFLESAAWRTETLDMIRGTRHSANSEHERWLHGAISELAWKVRIAADAGGETPQVELRPPRDGAPTLPWWSGAGTQRRFGRSTPPQTIIVDVTLREMRRWRDALVQRANAQASATQHSELAQLVIAQSKV